MCVCKKLKTIFRFAAVGWTIAAFGLMQVPIWAIVAIVKQAGQTWSEKITGAFRPTADWGPREPANFERYQKHLSNMENSQILRTNGNHFQRFKRNIFG